MQVVSLTATLGCSICDRFRRRSKENSDFILESRTIAVVWCTALSLIDRSLFQAVVRFSFFFRAVVASATPIPVAQHGVKRTFILELDNPTAKQQKAPSPGCVWHGGRGEIEQEPHHRVVCKDAGPV
jgi:hypothetical protein